MTAPTQQRFQPHDPLIDLVRKVKADPADRRTLEALAAAIAPGMLALARRFCRLEQEADEAAQDALVAVLQHLSDLQDAQSFRSWMYRIVYRASLRRHSGPGADAMTMTMTLDTLELPDLKGADPAEAAADNERVDLLKQALSELDREAAGLLHLLFVESLSLQEVAVVLGRPRTTIADLRDKALATLRGKLRRRGVSISEPAMAGALLLALPMPVPEAAVQRVVHAAFTRIDGLVGVAHPPPIRMRNPMLDRMSLSKAFLLSCMVTLVIAGIALVLRFPRRSSESATESTLRVMLNSIEGYKTLYGAFPVDRNLVDSHGESLEDAELETTINASVVRNLLSDHSLGRMTAVGEGRYRVLGDGRRVVIDEWGLPFVFKPLVEKRGMKWMVTGLVVYSTGPDGEHDWARLAYLAKAGKDCWPPSEGIRRQWPVGDLNFDNVYLDPAELER